MIEIKYMLCETIYSSHFTLIWCAALCIWGDRKYRARQTRLGAAARNGRNWVVWGGG